MRTYAVFILFPANTPIDNTVVLLFKKGYGVAPFGESHLLSDKFSPADFCGLRVSISKSFTAEQVRTSITDMLSEHKIAFYTVLVSSSECAIDFAWAGSNLVENNNSSSETINNPSTHKKPNVSYLRLIKSLDKEDIETEEKIEKSEDELEFSTETTSPENKE